MHVLLVSVRCHYLSVLEADWKFVQAALTLSVIAPKQLPDWLMQSPIQRKESTTSYLSFLIITPRSSWEIIMLLVQALHLKIFHPTTYRVRSINQTRFNFCPIGSTAASESGSDSKIEELMLASTAFLLFLLNLRFS